MKKKVSSPYSSVIFFSCWHSAELWFYMRELSQQKMYIKTQEIFNIQGAVNQWEFIIEKLLHLYEFHLYLWFELSEHLTEQVNEHDRSVVKDCKISEYQCLTGQQGEMVWDLHSHSYPFSELNLSSKPCWMKSSQYPNLSS